MTAKRLWLVIGALGVIATLVLGWFLLVSPLVDGGLQAEAEARQIEASNAELEAQIAVLAKQYEDIDLLRDELEQMLTSVPGDLDYAELIRQLEAAQVASGARIISVTPDDATPFTPAVPMVVELEEPADGEDAPPAAKPVIVDPTAGLAPVDPADTSILSSSGLVLVPIDLQLSGTPAQIVAFAEFLQRMPRLFLVTQIEALGLEPPTGSINGFVYVLPHEQIGEPEPESTPAPTPTPEPTETGTPTPTPTPTP